MLPPADRATAGAKVPSNAQTQQPVADPGQRRSPRRLIEGLRTAADPAGRPAGSARSVSTRRCRRWAWSDAHGFHAGLPGVRGACADGVGARTVGGPQPEGERTAATVRGAVTREDLAAVVGDPHRPGLTGSGCCPPRTRPRGGRRRAWPSASSGAPAARTVLITRAPPPPEASAAGARRATPLNAAAVTVTVAMVRRTFMVDSCGWPVSAGEASGQDNGARTEVTVARWSKVLGPEGGARHPTGRPPTGPRDR